MTGSSTPLVVRKPDDTIALCGGHFVTVDEYLARVNGLAALLPAAVPVMNVCEDRYCFLVSFGAALLRGSPTLLPPNPLEETLNSLHSAWPGSIVLTDRPRRRSSAPVLVIDTSAVGSTANPAIANGTLAAVAFTSGSTGVPAPQRKSWQMLVEGISINLGCYLGVGNGPHVMVSTVPAQHMYGLETTILSALHGPAVMHDGRPFYPENVRTALAESPGPNILVSTPIHLRALVGSGIAFPPVARVLSATAPIDAALAGAVERAFEAELIEIYGCTEVGSVAWRRAARGGRWRFLTGLYPHVLEGSTFIEASHLGAPVRLPDVLEFAIDGSFVLKGRDSDLVKVGGKRSSLGEVTRLLLAIPGVDDAVAFKPLGRADDARIAALIVSGSLDAAAIRAALRPVLDPAFIPRPIRIVSGLPRSPTGKLTREAIECLYRGTDSPGTREA